jgi:hypothetical protein
VPTRFAENVPTWRSSPRARCRALRGDTLASRHDAGRGGPRAHRELRPRVRRVEPAVVGGRNITAPTHSYSSLRRGRSDVVVRRRFRARLARGQSIERSRGPAPWPDTSVHEQVVMERLATCMAKDQRRVPI